MKNKLLTIALGSVMALSSAYGAVTVTIKNFTSATAGVVIVNNAGAPVAVNSIVASAGIFTTLPNWATASATDIITAFTALDATPVKNSSFTGVFSAADMSGGAYPANFSGANAYILVGNGTTIANSTLVAVYNSGSTFTPLVAGNANVTINATTPASWVYGKQTNLTSQPTVPSANFPVANGIQLTSVPEPSALLLGAVGVLGLLRRRRN